MRAAWLAIALGGCWTGSPPPPPVLESDAEPPGRIVRLSGARGRGLARRPPPRLTPAQRRFPDELRRVRADAFACVQRYRVTVPRTLWLEVTIDDTGQVVAARTTGFGPADACALAALRGRTFLVYTGTTITLTIPWPPA